MKLLYSSIFLSFISCSTYSNVIDSLDANEFDGKQARYILGNFKQACKIFNSERKANSRVLVNGGLDYPRFDAAMEMYLKPYSGSHRTTMENQYKIKSKTCHQKLNELNVEMETLKNNMQSRLTGEYIFSYYGIVIGQKNSSLQPNEKYSLKVAELELLSNVDKLAWTDSKDGRLYVNKFGIATNLQFPMLVPEIVEEDTKGGRTDGRNNSIYRAMFSIAHKLIDDYGFVSLSSPSEKVASMSLTDGTTLIRLKHDFNYLSVYFSPENRDFSKEPAIRKVMKSYIDSKLKKAKFLTFNADFDMSMKPDEEISLNSSK